MIEERVPVDLEALRTRQHLYALSQTSRRFEAQVSAAARQDRLCRNASQTTGLCIDENVARDAVSTEESHARGVLRGSIALLHDALQTRHLAAWRQRERCNVKFDARAAAVTSQLDEAALRDLDAGRTTMRQEREAKLQAVTEREASIAAKKKRNDDMRGARVYMLGEEARCRQHAHDAEASSRTALLRALREDAEDAKVREYDRWMNSDEQKQIAAEREKRIADEKAAIAKKENDFKRDQARLVSNCTHSRAGSSVFIGPLAKKMCLICKVKFDDVQGIYIRMP